MSTAVDGWITGVDEYSLRWLDCSSCAREADDKNAIFD
jgi:hypothetical protein